MKTSLVKAAFGSAAFLISVAFGLAQSPMIMPSTPIAGQGQKATNPSEMLMYAPSDIAALSSNVPGDHSLRGGRGHRFAASAAAGHTSVQGGLGVPRLCFEPGVGWTAVAVTAASSNSAVTEQATDPDNRAVTLPSTVRQRVISGKKSLNAIECPTVQLTQAATAATASDSADKGSNSQDESPFLTLEPGYGNSPSLLTNGSAAGTYQKAYDPPSLELTPGFENRDSGDTSNPGAALDELKALERRAYVSPIKLRELSRNAQDLETRFELRRMDTEARKEKTRRAARDEDGSAGMRGATQHRLVNSRDLAARKAECARNPDRSKSRVCSRLGF